MTTTRCSTLAACLVTLGLGALAGCASTPRGALHVDGDRPALLTSSGALELHVRDGRIIEVRPAVETPEGARERRLTTLDELRASWLEAVGTPLPEDHQHKALQLNGWVGLECVRAGRACGRQPDDAPRAMVIVRFE